jgi:hypothetical protein
VLRLKKRKPEIKQLKSLLKRLRRRRNDKLNVRREMLKKIV